MIEIEHVGGAATVTGSRHVVRTSRATVLLECGLFQGHRSESFARNRALGIDPREIDAVVLSHAHIDHSGALPVLHARGYGGPIYCTPATRDLCAPMLEDSARVQAADAKHIDRLVERGVDIQSVMPLYDLDQVADTLTQFVDVPYRHRRTIAPGIGLTLLDAGHVLGSAIVVLDVDDDGDRTRIAFTGDLGRSSLPILRDPEIPDGVHCLITESTYGDRLHPPIDATIDKLAATVTRVAARRGKIVIPSFALERAQEVIFALERLRAADKIPHVPVYVDSPLAVRITDVYRRHPDSLRSSIRGADGDDSPFDFDGLHYVSDVEESKAIDAGAGPAIVIAGSGMCEGGRVLHHLKATIEDPRNAIAIVGYMAEHTLGRRLAERRPEVRIFGIMRTRAAEVVNVDGFSAHADRDGLIDYAIAVRERGPLRRVILVHGEPVAQDALRGELERRDFPTVDVPARGDRIRL
jgi:metallo-beta-lactamase family protein